MAIKGDYAWEKLLVAVQGMSTSSLPLRDRLAAAYYDSLIRLSGKPSHHFPPELLEDWQAIDQAFCRAGAHDGEGIAAASLRELMDSEVVDLANQIVGLFSKVSAHRS